MSGKTPLLRANFRVDPTGADWTHAGAYPDDEAGFDGHWRGSRGSGGRACLCVRSGLWRTPHLAVQPFHFYRMRFTALAPRGCCYAFCFHDRRGRMLASDEHNALDPARGWKAHEVFTQAREEGATLRVAFIAKGGELRISTATVTEASAEAVLAWSDRLYATLPPVDIAAGAGQLSPLAGAIQRLRARGELRVVLLGDSIANDLGNSQVHLLIQRHYPGSTVRLLRSIRSGTGCGYFRRHVRRYVIDKRPHLVIVAGISHENSAAAIRSVIEQTRAALGRGVAFLVLTGAITPPGFGARDAERVFYDNVSRMHQPLHIATLDMRSLWEDYLTGCGHPRAWYQRDPIHANARGKQILGRMIEQCFIGGNDRGWTAAGIHV